MADPVPGCVDSAWQASLDFSTFAQRTCVRTADIRGPGAAGPDAIDRGAFVTFLDAQTWRGKVYSGGWVAASGEAAVTEPATGNELGRTGIAGPADIGRAAGQAAAAQAAWAATPHTQRAAILRKAAEIWLANAAEIESWSVREGGKIPPAAQFETHVATEEIFEAATLPNRSTGELIPSEQPRL